MYQIRKVYGALLLIVIIGCTVSDRLEDFLPEQEQQTEFLLGGVQEGILSYWDTSRRMPESLVELRAAMESHAVSTVDGWGSEYRYIRRVDRYCVLSAGADSTFSTGDDFGAGGEVIEGTLNQYRIESNEVMARCD